MASSVFIWPGLFSNDGATITFPTTISVTGGVSSSSPTAGIGYATGAGGTVTQGSGSGKATAVTLNTVCGTITMDAANLLAATVVSFTFNNTAIAANDMLLVTHVAAGSAGIYTIYSTGSSANSRSIDVRNNAAGAEAAAIVLRFVVIKAVTA